MNFAQHRVASGIVAAVAAWICWISFTQKPAEAFVFPRVISVFFLIFALVTFGKAMMGLTKVGGGLTRRQMRNMAPGLILGFIYIFWGAKALGFYVSSTLVFFMLLSIYDPAPNSEVRTWIRRTLISLGFLAIMYALFAMTLKVYTPRGVFF